LNKTKLQERAWWGNRTAALGAAMDEIEQVPGVSIQAGIVVVPMSAAPPTIAALAVVPVAPVTNQYLNSNAIIEVAYHCEVYGQNVVTTQQFHYSHVDVAGYPAGADFAHVIDSLARNWLYAMETYYTNEWKLRAISWLEPALVDKPDTSRPGYYLPAYRSKYEYAWTTPLTGTAAALPTGAEAPVFIGARVQKRTGRTGRKWRGSSRIYLQHEDFFSKNFLSVAGMNVVVGMLTAWPKIIQVTATLGGASMGNLAPVVFSNEDWLTITPGVTFAPFVSSAQIIATAATNVLGSQNSRKGAADRTRV